MVELESGIESCSLEKLGKCHRAESFKDVNACPRLTMDRGWVRREGRTVGQQSSEPLFSYGCVKSH